MTDLKQPLTKAERIQWRQHAQMVLKPYKGYSPLKQDRAYCETILRLLAEVEAEGTQLELR